MHTSALSLAISIPATTKPFCAIIQLPSLLGPGSKPMQLFGLRKTPGLSLAPRQALAAFEHHGLRSSDGRLVRAARSYILADFADTRARRKPLKPLRAGMPGDSGVLVVTRVRSITTIAHETAGALGIRHSPRPLWAEGFLQDSGAARREAANARLDVIASEAKQSISPRKGRMDCFASLAMT